MNVDKLKQALLTIKETRPAQFGYCNEFMQCQYCGKMYKTRVDTCDNPECPWHVITELESV